VLPGADDGERPRFRGGGWEAGAGGDSRARGAAVDDIAPRRDMAAVGRAKGMEIDGLALLGLSDLARASFD
jgi:hypothetical protein